ncbi:cell surface A33 antigen-like [Thunnus thynnus]|uniref:cell surface A33 antigen-like n=1 Tax=Thunnus thynnus TaxID=8237 RepID=UPI003528AAB6
MLTSQARGRGWVTKLHYQSGWSEYRFICTVIIYEPQLKGSSHPDPITDTEGDRLQLDCSAVGNPSPSYNWTLPSATGSPFSGVIVTIESVTLEHKGQYNCSVHNNIGTVTVKFNVDVKENYMYIILVVVSVIALAAIVFISGFIHLYKHNRMGRYNVRDVKR